MIPETLAERVDALRQFNRLFTRRIGVLREGLLHTPFGLAEARVLYELAQRDDLTAAALGRELGLDQGYLSRLLGKLEQQGLLERTRAEDDARRLLLRLTPAGRDAFAPLDQRARDEIADLLGGLSDVEQRRLLEATQTISGLLEHGLKYAEPFVLRPHEPGDMGWVIHRHGVLYRQEYGWNEHFEALVAQICADFITNYDPEREHCWIAEMNSAIVGSAFVVKADETTAKLRLLLVEPSARGLGLGAALIDACIRFARRSGYTTLRLWTNSILVAARHLYTRAGFVLVDEEPHHSYGHDLVGETWELKL